MVTAYAFTAALWMTCWVPLIVMQACGAFEGMTWALRAAIYCFAPFWFALALISIAIHHLFPCVPASPTTPAGTSAPTTGSPVPVRRSPQQSPAVVAADAGERAA